MRQKFEEQLARLNSMLIEMGAMTEKAIECCNKALVNQDPEHARAAIVYDLEIDQQEGDIEDLCIKLLLQQQPVARDLRLVTAALKMITDMERIGDHAADISEISLHLSETPYIKPLVHIPQMAESTAKMVTTAIDAFVKKDLDVAMEVIWMDDTVDSLFDEIKNELIGLIRQDATNGEQAIDWLMIAKYFERIGDHAENIAEWVVFSITGQNGKEYKRQAKRERRAANG